MSNVSLIEYSAEKRAGVSARGRHFRQGLCVVAVFGLLLFVPAVPVWEQVTSVDGVTGSIKWVRTGPFHVPVGSGGTLSGLETALAKRGIPWTPRWQGLGSRDESLFGGALGIACGSAPAVYNLNSFSASFFDNVSDAELQTLAATFGTGTDTQQRAAADAMADLVFERVKPGK